MPDKNNFMLSTEGPLSLKSVWMEWKWWLPGAVFSFILASVLMSGWPDGLLPNMQYPFIYQKDGLFTLWNIQCLNEGSVLDNLRNGYPFGSFFADYPNSDAGNLLVLKLLTLLTSSSFKALNLYFLLGFVVVFLTSYPVFRLFGLVKPLAFTAAFTFNFASFHFLRLIHLSYTWYFVIPIFYYIGWKLFTFSDRCMITALIKKHAGICLLSIFVLSSFGVYYALFGVILICIAGFCGSVRNKTIYNAAIAGVIVSIIIFCVFINITPNIIYKYKFGINPGAVVRSPVGGEIYGFKMAQLLLPRTDHRISTLANLANIYNSHFPLVNENITSTLGVIGSIGLSILFMAFVLSFNGVDIDIRLKYISIVVFILFMFGTIGGLGAIFSLIISPSIRAWNRISIFIAFGTVLASFISLQLLIGHFNTSEKSMYLALSSCFILFIALYDQTAPADISYNEQTKSAFLMDRSFISQIENSVAPNSAVFQMPYMQFPEVPPVNNLQDYDMCIGFIHSKHLRWSYAGMKGRDADLLYRRLSQEPLLRQIDVIRKLGFSGIYVDKRGFEDNASDLISKLTQILGSAPSLSRADDKIVFFILNNAEKVDFSGMKLKEIMIKVGIRQL